MKNRILAVVAVGLLAAVPLADANVVTLRDWTTGDFATNAPNGGGPFQATTTGTLLGSQAFVTFCLEFNEYFNYNVSYNFSLSDAAMNGGVSGGNPDPVSDATKWLYYQVATNGYAAYSPYFGTGAGVGARVQEAIWWLEGERTTIQVNSAAVDLANFASTQNWGALYDLGHRVWAMNLTDADFRRAQDQLAYTRVPASVPEPGSLMLLGIGILGFGLARRRKQG